MTRVRQVLECDATELATRRDPRRDIVVERAVGDDRWRAAEGPFRSYERTLSAEPLDGERFTVTETTDYRLAVPTWAWLLWWPVKHAIANRRPDYGYWWAPPDRLDQRASAVLALLCTLQVVDGYLGTVLTQTLTFAADEFGRGNTAQSWVFGIVRFGVLISLAATALADRRGRRGLVLATAIGSCLFTALGAFAPDLWWIAATQLVSRGLSIGLGILIVIMAAEEMPARSRAWAASVLSLTAGLGSGMAVWVLPIADLDPRGWRVIYLVPLLAIPVIRWVGRYLPETARFETSTHIPAPSDEDTIERRRRRLQLLAVSAFLISMYAAPASGFQNDFLKDERGFSASSVTVFTLVTSTPAGLGVLVGGRLAETRGRRKVGAFGLTAGAILSASSFFASGPPLWLLAVSGTILGASAIPAIAIYGPELFGTHDRGRSNATIVLFGVIGSVVGLLSAGIASDRLDGELGPPLAVLALGPLVVAGLVLTKYPETAGHELEELNPEDDDVGDDPERTPGEPASNVDEPSNDDRPV